MFSMRKTLGSGLHWDRPFLSQLGANLTDAGFAGLSVKLPVNLTAIANSSFPGQQIIEDELLNREVTFQEFLDNERNYPAVILVASNEAREETMKVLFGNTSKKTLFMDDTFPSGHSIPSQLYVQSPDPARVYSLINFFHEFLRKQADTTAFLTTVGALALLLTGAQVVAFVASGQGLLAGTWGLNPLFDIAAVIGLVLVQYSAFRAPTGLSVNERETQTARSLVVRAMRGELRDNPIVNLVIGVLGALIGAFILRLIGWL